MKSISKILILFCVGVMATGCNDFLTKNPETSLAPGTFFSSEAELELWTNRFYALFDGADDEALQLSDIQICKSLNSVQQGTRSPATQSWSWTYLRYINYYFEHSSNCKDESVRLRYDGVSHFFRALFYFNMVKVYGDVPYYDYVISSEDVASLKRPRDDRGYVMLKIMADLDAAIEMLPAAWPTDPFYHVNKYAAMALKARIALFEGTFRKYHNIADVTFDGVTVSPDYFLALAAEAANKIITTKKYSLYKSSTLGVGGAYREFFILEDGDAKETILSIRYNSDVLVRHGVQFTYRNMRHSMTRRFTNHYLMADGSRIQDKAGYATMSYYEQFLNRDPRMAQTLLAPGYKDYGSTSELIEDCSTYDMTGYRIIKHISDSSHDGATTSTSDWSVFRYPEILLIYAEAQAELGLLTQDDINQTVNLIRDRVGMKHLDLTAANASPDALLESYYPNVNKGANKGVILEIRRERTIELCCEGGRQWDMFRWREGAQLVPASNGESGFRGCYFPSLGEFDMNGDGTKDLCLWSGTKPSTTCDTVLEVGTGKDIQLTDGTSGYIVCFGAAPYKWDETRDYLWPIPTDQRVATGGALSQNQGYSDGLSF